MPAAIGTKNTDFGEVERNARVPQQFLFVRDTCRQQGVNQPAVDTTAVDTTAVDTSAVATTAKCVLFR